MAEMQPTPPALPPAFRILESSMGWWAPQVLYAAARLRIPEALAAGPRRPQDVAETIGAHPGAVERIMTALVLLGLCVRESDGTLALTPSGHCLREDAPDSVRSWVLFINGPLAWRAFGRLAECVATGCDAFRTS